MNKACKVVSILLAMTLASSMTGCSGNKDSVVTNVQTNQPPAEISTFFQEPYIYGDLNNMALLREIEKKTNTKLTIVEAPSGQAPQKLNLLISSGQCPDLVKAKIEIVNKYGTEEALHPMDEIIDKYMPTAKKVLSKDIINKLKASDNKLYTAPLIRESGTGALFVREDWLKKLNIEPPKTLDEYYSMLKAFTEKDPDGNGKKDTFGTSLSEGNTSGIDKFTSISGPFGLPKEVEFVDAGDGSVTLSCVHPRMKDALAFGAKLYKEGLMDPEFATMKKAQFEENVANNRIGLMQHVSSAASKLQKTLNKKVPDAKYSILDVPVAPGVKKGMAAISQVVEGQKAISYHIGISKSTKQLERVAKFLDWNYTDESTILQTFGIEGMHYTMESGKPKFKPEYLGQDNMPNRQKEGLFDAYLFAGYMGQSDATLQVYDSETLKNIDASIKNSLPKLVYFTTATEDSIKPEINKAMVEYYTKIIMGGLSVEDGWNQWLKEFDRIGGNKVIKETNDILKKRK